ncbi:FtsX-like permease family protein [Corynebacterium sp.]|uniref:FtsX-like permease family protein n=1 Tax=Corynebacterium sp. TaxID=1720 RepID=UPI0026DB2116|nr:FtsX-like permease family protein [Corynebacterium sp.]MDO5032271.1 FtsX-like permease family protein [Corynebacterium sp.]
MRTSVLTLDLHRESIRARSGTGLVSLLAIVSLTVGSTIAFLVAGGTWMFFNRAQHPADADPGLAALYNDIEGFLYIWFYLALFACAFLLPALFSLTAQSAVLGASGRERRLATLRFLGLSSRDVVRMTVLETGVQALMGIVLGGLLSVLVAPALTHLSFQERRIQLQEILLPWWGYLLVAAVLFAVALLAAFAGMQRVRVSPLGVARREVPSALKRWRLWLFLGVLVLGTAVLTTFSFSASMGVMIVFVGIIFVIVMSINLVGPYVLQAGALVAANFPGTAHLVACQRVAANSRRVWRRVAAIAFFGFLAGYLVGAPLGSDGLTRAMREEDYVFTLFHDLSVGALLTLAFGFIVVAVSIFLGQVSGVFEDGELLRSLDLMGISRRFMLKVNVLEILGPAVALSLVGFMVGALQGMVMFAGAEGAEVDVLGRILLALGFLAAGWITTLLALLAVEPLRGYVLRDGRRKE